MMIDVTKCRASRLISSRIERLMHISLVGRSVARAYYFDSAISRAVGGHDDPPARMYYRLRGVHGTGHSVFALLSPNTLHVNLPEAEHWLWLSVSIMRERIDEVEEAGKLVQRVT